MTKKTNQKKKKGGVSVTGDLAALLPARHNWGWGFVKFPMDRNRSD